MQANAHAQAHQHANAQAVQLETIPSTGELLVQSCRHTVPYMSPRGS